MPSTSGLPSASRTYGVTGLGAAKGMVWVAYPGRGLVRVDLGAGDRVVAVRSGSRLLLADPDKGMVRATMPAPGRAAPAWPWTAG